MKQKTSIECSTQHPVETLTKSPYPLPSTPFPNICIVIQKTKPTYLKDGKLGSALLLQWLLYEQRFFIMHSFFQYCSFDLTLHYFTYFFFSVIIVIICLPFLLLYIAMFMHFHFLLFFCFAVLLFFYSCNSCIVLFFSIHLILSFTTITKII